MDRGGSRDNTVSAPVHGAELIGEVRRSREWVEARGSGKGL